MSNPFGTPFTSQQNSAVFGSTTSQQGAFGAPSVFGQQSVFGQTTTTSAFPSTDTVSTSGSVFGQAQATTVGTQPGLFGSKAMPPPSYASSVFGQSSRFGQGSVSGPSSEGTGSSVFSKPATTSSLGTQNVFGGTPFGGGSNLSHSTGSGLFGNPGQSFSFQKSTQQTSSSFGQPTTQSNIFSSGGTPFGRESSGNASSAAPSLFTGLATVKSEPSSATSSSTGLFGKQSAVAGSNAATSNLFGKPSDPASSSVATSSLFGKSTTASTGSIFAKVEKVDDVKPTSFGGGYQTNTARNQDIKPTGLFGKVKQESIANSAETKTLPSTIFGGNSSQQENLSAGTDRAQGKGLFGKGKPEISEEEHKGLFGKRKPEHGGAKDTGLFGKGKTLSQTLFRNPVKEEDITKGCDDTAGYSQENEDENPLQHHSGLGGNRSSTKGLFGKPFQKGETSGTGLLSKPASSRARAPSTSDDKEESKSSLRRQMSEEISSKVAIVCRNVPHKYNTIMNLRSHFKRFGEVTKVFPNQAKMQATVHFRTHEAAAEAKVRGRILARGVLPMTIFWSQYARTATPKATKSSPDVDVKPTRPVKRTSDTDLLPRSKKPSWKGTDTVDEELENMAGTQDIKGRVKELTRSPEKRSRSVSPTPSTSSSVDIKSDKIVTSMFEGCVARTTTERVNLLRLRDKYIRQNRVKGKKDMVKAFVGTCPDMCPEKERYDREDKRQLSYYEIIPGTENIPGRNPQVDHSRAVKEYLRSSPDQDEPLPHELRPIPVLQSTMTYLLCEVANREEDGRWGDWFDFLWNRTRGIRKDIIQQQLNDRDAVDLIEKCARFHIYCSERLCEEDMHSFDAKINNENLTKCLQTLKEFYADLEKKHKCYCENEAEFRAYMVLMNLNQGDILREVQQLRPGIRTSPAIKFALHAYFALNGNNYIKFFRLVKQASFSNACIMHRYFTQVRNRALLLMMRGYSMGNRSAQIPVSELVRLLGFESDSEATDFSQHYGFNVNDGEMVLDKAEYIEPDTAWLPVRSVSLIESKLMVSPGEFINGGTFRETTHLSPVSSFDDNGRFHSQIELPKKGFEPASSSQATSSTQPPSNIQQAEVKVKHEPVQEETERGAAVEADKPSLKKVPVEFIKDSAKFLFWEVIDEMCKGIGEEVKSEVDAKLHFSNDYLEGILIPTLKNEIRTVCEDTYEEAQEQKRKALHLEKELRRDRVAELLTDDFVNDLIHQESLNLATIEMREVKAQLRRECIERVTIDINDELVEEVMSEMVVDVSEDVFETDVRQRLKQLDDFEKLVKLSRAGRFWHKWKKEYKAVTKLKRAMEEFPCAPNMQTRKEQLNLLLNVDNESIVDKKFYVNKRAKLTIETPLEIEKHRKETETCALVHRLYRNLLHQTAWAPLDLGRLVGKELNRKARHVHQRNTLKATTLFWKVLLCLPDVDGNSISNHSEAATHNLCKWLKVRFSKGSSLSSQLDVKGHVLSLYKCHLADALASKPVSLGVCVRTVEGQLDDDDIAAIEETSLYLGANALLFLLPAGALLSKLNSVKSDQYWTAQYFRLKAILDVKPRYQGFPLVIVIPVPANQSVSLIQIVKCLSLEEFLDEELLSDVELVTCELNENRPDGIDLTDPRISEELCESIQWLAKKSKPIPCVTVQYFKDTVDLTLHQHYYTPVQHNHKKRKQLERLNKDPNSLLGLYNTVITHLSEVLTSERLFKVSWPVAEFASKQNTDLPPNHWNRGDHLEYLFSIVDSLRLPKFELSNPDPEDWFDVKRDLWEFVSSFAGSDYSGARIKLFSRLKNLIHKLEVDFEEACYFQYGEADCQPTFFNVPWSTVVSLCIDYKLDSIDLTDPHTPDPQEKRELKVAYIKEEMEGFIPPESWKHIEADRTVLECPALEDTVKRVVYRVQEERKKSLMKTEISITEDPVNVSVVAMDTKKTSSTLIKSLKSERRQSDHFQKYLEDALKDVDPDLNHSLTESASFSVFETENQSFGAGNFSSLTSRRRFSFDPVSNQKSFDATSYFNQSQNNISAIFAPENEGRTLLPPSRRKSDIGLQELSVLPGKKRRERLSEIYNNDKVMMYIKEPTVSEDVENFRENLKASRRESDLFEKKLRLMLQDRPESF
ncbi:germinal-center associated nuclear protein-like isoform X2 [Mercenaria mercenaria]|uniref:germinal-center associated nuclear protein-like isoform X2 n=1 Tax=Mercenaria mercenaria TaxID=6596 RepID=UPI00234F2C9B|nr:germinal-center associated nuclear protein-like isoform X2 [Mercenaria mercenaria]